MGRLSRSGEYEQFLEPFWRRYATQGICVSVGDGPQTCDAIKNLVVDNNWLGVFMQASLSEARDIAQWSTPYHLKAIVDHADWRDGVTVWLRGKNLMADFDMLHIDCGRETMAALQDILVNGYFKPKLILCAHQEGEGDIEAFALLYGYERRWVGKETIAFLHNPAA